MTIAIPAISDENVQVPVRLRQGDTFIDPTGWPVSIAFMDPGEQPSSLDWESATWATGTYPRYWAIAAPAMPVGTYDVWIRIESPSRDIQRPAGRMIVT